MPPNTNPLTEVAAAVNGLSTEATSLRLEVAEYDRKRQRDSLVVITLVTLMLIGLIFSGYSAYQFSQFLPGGKERVKSEKQTADFIKGLNDQNANRHRETRRIMYFIGACRTTSKTEAELKSCLGDHLHFTTDRLDAELGLR